MARIHLVEEMRARAWTLRYSKCELRTRRSKVPGERKPGRNAALKCLGGPQGRASLRACPWVCPHRLFSCLLHTAFCLCGSSFPQGRCTRASPLATGPCGSSGEDAALPRLSLTFIPGQEPKPCFEAPQAGASRSVPLASAKELAWCCKHSVSGAQICSVVGFIVPLSGLLRLVPFGS